MPNEHVPPLLEALVATYVSEYDRIAPDVYVAHGCSGTCRGDVFQTPRQSDKTVSLKGKRRQKIFLVVKRQTIFDQQALDDDLAQLYELYGPRASQLPTLKIFHRRRV